eukprot:gene18000-biopygen7599
MGASVTASAKAFRIQRSSVPAAGGPEVPSRCILTESLWTRGRGQWPRLRSATAHVGPGGVQPPAYLVGWSSKQVLQKAEPGLGVIDACNRTKDQVDTRGTREASPPRGRECPSPSRAAREAGSPSGCVATH